MACRPPKPRHGQGWAGARVDGLVPAWLASDLCPLALLKVMTLLPTKSLPLWEKIREEVKTLEADIFGRT